MSKALRMSKPLSPERRRWYPNTNGAGAGSLTGPSDLGIVVFSRSESNALAAASWGEFTTVTNTKSAVIWAKKRENLLCL